MLVLCNSMELLNSFWFCRNSIEDSVGSTICDDFGQFTIFLNWNLLAAGSQNPGSKCINCIYVCIYRYIFWMIETLFTYLYLLLQCLGPRYIDGCCKWCLNHHICNATPAYNLPPALSNLYGFSWSVQTPTLTGIVKLSSLSFACFKLKIVLNMSFYLPLHAVNLKLFVFVCQSGRQFNQLWVWVYIHTLKVTPPLACDKPKVSNQPWTGAHSYVCRECLESA